MAVFKVGKWEFEKGTHVMGILNVTDDSFYTPSRLKDDLLTRVEQMINDGAEIIDIGGQSTRPGAEMISPEEELVRVFPVVAQIKKNFDIAVSVDTFHASVAKTCLKAEADMINDVSGLTYDKEMAKVIGKADASVCIMHNRRSSPKDSELMKDVIDGLHNAVDLARVSGVKKSKIILDGGIGFNLNSDEDWKLLFSYVKLKSIGYPLLLGTSRKSFFGGEVEGRLQPTLNTTALATRKKVLFVRVHDIKENKEVIDAVLRAMEEEK